MSRNLFIKTYGCQMNVYDSARMAESLRPHGYTPVETADQADLVILNTCHIREKAAEKVYSDLGRLRVQREERRAATGQDTLIAVAGCVAQAEGEAMLARAPFVDLVVGPQTYHRLPELLAQRARQAGGVVDTDFPIESKFDHLPEARGTSGPAAFLSVQEGCDKFCAFCVVPYTRGAEVSRPVAAVRAEAERLVAAGAREITLLGQNVNAYHGEGPDGREWSLARLILALAEIDGLARLRYTTSHPRDMTADLIAAHRDCPALMPYLHLPVQSGSDRVLALMNRKHDAADYRRIIDDLRAVRPDLALSSDFIVGHPGETDEDFRATLRLIEAVRFASAFSFKYSPRPGTPAASLGKQVKEQVKTERLAELQALLAAQTRAFNRATVGRRLPVLFERPGRHAGQLIGRTPYLQAVHVEAAERRRIGDLVEVAITACGSNSLAGALPADAAAPTSTASSAHVAAATPLATTHG